MRAIKKEIAILTPRNDCSLAGIANCIKAIQKYQKIRSNKNNKADHEPAIKQYKSLLLKKLYRLLKANKVQ